MNEIDDIMQSAGYTHSSGLQKILDDTIAGEKKKNPYWPIDAPFADLQKDDEDMDTLLMAGKFQINACLVSYYRQIKHYKIDELLSKIGIGAKGLFEILNALCKNIEDNTDKPIFVQNTVTDAIKYFDNYPGCGQVIQILALQGLVSWFENCNINDSDPSYSEAKSLYDWVDQRLIEVSAFYFDNFTKDENSKPLDDYLATLDVGKAWEQLQNSKKEAAGNPVDTITDNVEQGIFSEYLLSDIHRQCNEVQFNSIQLGKFTATMNNPTENPGVLSIRKGEKLRMYHLIDKLAKTIMNDDKKGAWLNAMLSCLGVDAGTYKSKYAEVGRDDLNSKNMDFRGALNEIFEKHEA